MSGEPSPKPLGPPFCRGARGKEAGREANLLAPMADGAAEAAAGGLGGPPRGGSGCVASGAGAAGGAGRRRNAAPAGPWVAPSSAKASAASATVSRQPPPLCPSRSASSERAATSAAGRLVVRPLAPLRPAMSFRISRAASFCRTAVLGLALNTPLSRIAAMRSPGISDANGQDSFHALRARSGCPGCLQAGAAFSAAPVELSVCPNECRRWMGMDAVLDRPCSDNPPWLLPARLRTSAAEASPPRIPVVKGTAVLAS
mmetsp:Transcript_45532/g.142796  ORF Transcript_45532/g.142796 Transcript_45532/m.142796 type:complete len:258 (+) Transcript_45532:218-991(+)